MDEIKLYLWNLYPKDMRRSVFETVEETSLNMDG